MIQVPKEQRWDGTNVAAVAFRAATTLKKDGADIRVVTPAGIEMAHEILYAAPGKRCVLLFRTRKAERRYYIYSGNPNAEATGKNLDAGRGLILSTGPRSKIRCNSIEDMRRILDTSEPVYGRAPVPNVFLGHNPFGRSTLFWSAFRGYIRIPESGVYTFATNSCDSSFVFIDGKPVVSWPGRHNPYGGLYGEHSGKVELTPGMHRFEYLHEVTRGRMAAVLGWIPPGKKTVALVPADAFPGFLKSKAGTLERRDGSLVADFTFKPLGSARGFGGDFYAVAFRSASRTVTGLRPKSWHWDFGDGRTSTLEHPSHLYLRKGIHLVTLTVGKDAPRAQLFVNTTIEIPRPALDRLGKMAPLLIGIDLTELTVADLKIVFRVADQYGDKPVKAPVLKEVLRRAHEFEAKEVGGAALALGDYLTADTPELAEARAAYTVALERLGKTKGGRQARLGIIWVDYLVTRDAEAVREDLKALAEEFEKEAPDEARLALIRAAEVHLDQGEGKEAASLFEKAQSLRRKIPTPEEALIRKGDFATRTENHLFRKDYYKALEAVREWELAFPGEKLVGFSTSRKLRALFGLGRLDHVVEEAARFLGLGIKNHFTPAVRYYAGQAHWARGEMERALELFDGVITDFPEAPEAAKARKMAARVRRILARRK